MSQTEVHGADWKNRDRYAEMVSDGMSPEEIHSEISAEHPQVTIPDLRDYLVRCKLIDDTEGGKWSPEDSVPLRLINKLDVSFPLPQELLDDSEFPVEIVDQLPIAFYPIIDATKTGTKFGLRAVPCDYDDDDNKHWNNERKCFDVGGRSMEFRLPRRIAHSTGLLEMFDDYTPGTDKLQLKSDSGVVEDGILSGVGSNPSFGDTGDAETPAGGSNESEVILDMSIENGGITAHFSPAPAVWTPTSVDDPLAEMSTTPFPAPEGGESISPREISFGRSWNHDQLYKSVTGDEPTISGDDMKEWAEQHKEPWNVTGYQLVFPSTYADAYEVEVGDAVHQHYGAVWIDGVRHLAYIIRFGDASDVPSIRTTVFEGKKNETDSATYNYKMISPNSTLLHSLGILVDDDNNEPAKALMYPGEDYIAIIPNDGRFEDDD
ncbi:hypothetical protein ACFQDD_00500 [Halorubrum pallidum]|uniref:Uncharacterized protein n=1 Tax=Halorubrum pallidum TaxID=1526114 RepID=A0ABD5T1C0_9EURY